MRRPNIKGNQRYSLSQLEPIRKMTQAHEKKYTTFGKLRCLDTFRQLMLQPHKRCYNFLKLFLCHNAARIISTYLPALYQHLLRTVELQYKPQKLEATKIELISLTFHAQTILRPYPMIRPPVTVAFPVRFSVQMWNDVHAFPFSMPRLDNKFLLLASVNLLPPLCHHVASISLGPRTTSRQTSSASLENTPQTSTFSKTEIDYTIYSILCERTSIRQALKVGRYKSSSEYSLQLLV